LLGEGYAQGLAGTASEIVRRALAADWHAPTQKPKLRRHSRPAGAI